MMDFLQVHFAFDTMLLQFVWLFWNASLNKNSLDLEILMFSHEPDSLWQINYHRFIHVANQKTDNSHLHQYTSSRYVSRNGSSFSYQLIHAECSNDMVHQPINKPTAQRFLKQVTIWKSKLSLIGMLSQKEKQGYSVFSA